MFSMDLLRKGMDCETKTEKNRDRVETKGSLCHQRCCVAIWERKVEKPELYRRNYDQNLRKMEEKAKNGI